MLSPGSGLKKRPVWRQGLVLSPSMELKRRKSLLGPGSGLKKSIDIRPQAVEETTSRSGEETIFESWFWDAKESM